MNRRKFMGLGALVGAVFTAPAVAIAYGVVQTSRRVHRVNPGTIVVTAQDNQQFGISMFRETDNRGEFEVIWSRR